MSNITRFRGPTIRPYIRKRFVDVEDGYLVDPDWDPDTWPSDLDPESASPYQALKYGPYAIGSRSSPCCQRLNSVVWVYVWSKGTALAQVFVASASPAMWLS